MSIETIVTLALAILGAAFEAGRMRNKIDSVATGLARVERKLDAALNERRLSPEHDGLARAIPPQRNA